MPDKIKEAVNEFVVNVYAARKKRGWSQKELGERIGESQPDVSRALSGQVTPKTDEIRRKIVHILGMEESK
ncbi:helix-turn-helix transcriptional regulator [Lacticaseibacillus sp. BCRC 81376]|uniref:helix-turn-helix domain-containing protein n=1 Tax=Lacticaseibacillus sp. BCRC 81376 TaxID=3036496 RepID=UPI00240FB613|nr:helix-turn-helix transcriptional regulator [Lacticaseibacillus sp. BCRC 81376]MDG3060330.1 helix-turn-helix transcriptional regulator [Lacticaseibacillus sp. BCRC 81376]MDG3060387.1 helix-turn-helix transcriptional regulator [Lacticaseibacillus sp. BCRC 81376]